MSAAPSESGLLDTGPEFDFTARIAEIARRAWQDPLLRAFGAPAPDGPCPAGASGSALLALHLAAVYHRLAVMCDVVADYGRRAALPAGEPVYLDAILASAGGQPPRRIAQVLYRRAVTTDPALAEAHFGYARVAMALGNAPMALEHLARSVALTPHPTAPAHANLHASAFWHRATLLEDDGDDAGALQSYREALSRVASFGVHHVRAANFFRRIGLLEEAAAQYRKCMDYSHFYFAEFILPPLEPAGAVAASAAPEPIYTTSRGEIVAYWQAQYHAVPESSWRDWRDGVLADDARRGASRRLLHAIKQLIGRDRRMTGLSVRRAQSIAAFEEPSKPDAAASGRG